MPDVVHVVARVERMEIPFSEFGSVAVKDVEQIEFDDDSALAGGADEICEAPKKCFVPAVEVELIAAVEIAGRGAAGPGREETAGARCEGVLVASAIGAGVGAFEGGAGNGAGEIHALGQEGVQVSEVIEVLVQDCTVMFAGADEHGGFAAKQEIMRILGMKTKWLGRRCGCTRREDKQKSEDTCAGLDHESDSAGSVSRRPARDLERENRFGRIVVSSLRGCGLLPCCRSQSFENETLDVLSITQPNQKTDP